MFGGGDRFEEEKDAAGPKALIQLEDTNVFDLPKPIYPNVIAIGVINRQTRLDQILLQLDIPVSDYVYWTSDVQLKVQLSPKHYVPSLDCPEPAQIRAQSAGAASP